MAKVITGKAKAAVKGKDSKRLVIDASIARSAGGSKATVACSTHCRDFLKSVLEICHRIVMTPEMMSEKKNTQSPGCKMEQRLKRKGNLAMG